jgi:hypothetical protein
LIDGRVLVQTNGSDFVERGRLYDIPLGYADKWTISSTGESQRAIDLSHLNRGQVVKASFLVRDRLADDIAVSCPMPDVETIEEHPTTRPTVVVRVPVLGVVEIPVPTLTSAGLVLAVVALATALMAAVAGLVSLSSADGDIVTAHVPTGSFISAAPTCRDGRLAIGVHASDVGLIFTNPSGAEQIIFATAVTAVDGEWAVDLERDGDGPFPLTIAPHTGVTVTVSLDAFVPYAGAADGVWAAADALLDPGELGRFEFETDNGKELMITARFNMAESPTSNAAPGFRELPAATATCV